MSALLRPAAFAAGVRDVINLLETHFLNHKDLANDLDTILGAPSGPVNMTGARPGRGRLGFSPRRSLEPTRDEVAELGCSVTRLDRMLDRLIGIAKRHKWMSPYPNVACALAGADAVRESHRIAVRDFVTDRAHLRHLAMAAADLPALLVVSEEEGVR